MRARLLSFAAGLLVVAVLAPTAVLGHNNWFHCSSGAHTHWLANTVSYQRPSTWAASYRNAIDAAANSITGATDFNYVVATSGSLKWANLNNPDVSVAGQTNVVARQSDCALLSPMSIFINFPHFDATAHSQDQKQCTAIHEFGHGLGLDHAPSGTSIMRADHNLRCHSNLWITVKPDDIADINAQY